jgi:HEAT repeat protein
MRKLVLSSLFALSVFTTSGCKEPDPYAYETHIENIRNASAKGIGFSGMKDLVKTVITSPDNGPRLDEFVQKVIPVFEEQWDSSPEHQANMLEMLRDIGRPEAAPLWSKALGTLDGSEEGRKRVLIALQGIQRAKATGSTDAVLGLFEGLTKDPGKDKGKAEGEIRRELARTLGILKDPKAVDPLIAALQQPTEMRPPQIHRIVAEALGNLRDPKAIEPLVIANFSIPDDQTDSKNLSNRVKLALNSIGEPAVPRLVELLTGKEDDIVIKKVVEAGSTVPVVRFTAALMLGSLGSPTAVDALVKNIPEASCKPVVKEDPKKKDKKKKAAEEEEEDPDKADNENLRNAIVTSLGQIGDPKAAAAVCPCTQATVHFEEQFMMTEALGYIGGDEATKCLINFLKTAESDPETLPTTDKTPLSIRVEAGRFAVLAAGPDQVAAVREAFAANTDPKVAEGLKQWEPALTTLETCKSDKDCYLKTLKDTNASWVARENAAMELTRVAPGDAAVAEAIAQAYKVREVDARVTMALMASRIMQGKRCQKCVDTLEDIMKGEKGTTDISYQKAVLTARDTIAKLGE